MKGKMMRLGNCFPPCPVIVGRNVCITTEIDAIPFKLDCASLMAIHFLFMCRMQPVVQHYEYFCISLLAILFCQDVFNILHLTYVYFVLQCPHMQIPNQSKIGWFLPCYIWCTNVHKPAYPLIKTDN